MSTGSGRSLIRVVSLVVLLIAVGGCSESGPPYEVESEVVVGDGTRDVTVWSPVADGSWPVVYAVPGSGGSAEGDLGVLATELASHGVVVFGTDVVSSSHQRDIECGYRFTRDHADDYGGDVTQPVTMVGYSVGAADALIHGLNSDAFSPESTNPVDVACPPGAPRPEIIVSISGCHVTFTGVEGRVRYWDNKDADITLVSGADDDVCRSKESIEAQAVLRAAGYNASYVEIPDANHWEVVFHDLSYGSFKTLETDNPAGQATVETILTAIGVEQQATE
mgnify:CR=1 FL=1